jgi:hypothetical protein
MRLPRVWQPIILACLLILAAPSTTSAHYLSHSDANDTSQPLDLQKVAMHLHHETRNFVLKVRTFDRFRLRRDGYIYGYLDSYGPPRRDYTIRGWYDPGHGLIVEMWERGGRETLPIPAVIRPHLLRTKIPAGRHGIRRNKHLRWRVRTTRFDRFVIDRAPDGGSWFPH